MAAPLSNKERMKIKRQDMPVQEADVRVATSRKSRWA